MGPFTKTAATRGGNPFRQRLSGMPDLGQRADGWTDWQWSWAPTCSVRLTDLIATNRGRYLDEDRVARYVRAAPSGKPYVLRHGNRLYLVDGHHRAVAAYRRGETHIQARVKTV